MKTLRYKTNEWTTEITELDTEDALEHYLDSNSDDYESGQLETMRYKINYLSKVVAKLLDKLDEQEILDILDFKSIN